MVAPALADVPYIASSPAIASGAGNYLLGVPVAGQALGGRVGTALLALAGSPFLF